MAESINNYLNNEQTKKIIKTPYIVYRVKISGCAELRLGDE